MLSILGQSYRLCDGVSRRAFLKLGSLAMSGLTLADILRAEAVAGTRRSHKSVIMIFMPGGPSHLDLYDLKPEAPVEVRGEFRPIRSAVPGIQICEHLPKLARIMDKLAPVRTIVGGPDDHAVNMCMTGWNRLGPQPLGGWPTFGSFISKLQGPIDPTMPPYVGLAAKMIHPPYNDPGPGFLGAAHSAFTPDGECRANMTLSGISLDRLSDRRALLTHFDRLRREVDSGGALQGLDAFQQQAFRVITSSKLRDALDLSHESPKVVSRYGSGDPSLVEGFNAAPKLTEHLLMARRLVEAGARCVTLAFGAWDWHMTNFVGMKKEMPLFDHGVAALVEDLHQRGLDKDVLVVAWGEFGRSPRVNAAAGRDHWPGVSCALLAGGGLRTGQVIGTTNHLAEMPLDRPVHFQEVLATIYHHLGIDVAETTVPDLNGRPRYLVEDYRPIAELS
ncbi:MAG: DUF1501 domain-containing protein [Planctomycetia bacterium]|nr:DUF1501 domain-containing protein [Planctomycetia bacterium]